MKLILPCVIAVLTMGALPPLSSTELDTASQLVVTGTVQGIYTATVQSEGKAGWTDEHLVLKVRVDTVTKGKAEVGKVVYLHAWHSDKRPDGWTGNGGHRGLPAVGQSGKFYVKVKADGSLAILGPNGSSKLPKPTK